MLPYKCPRCRDSKYTGISSLILDKNKDISLEEITLNLCTECQNKKIENNHPYKPDDEDLRIDNTV